MNKHEEVELSLAYVKKFNDKTLTESEFKIALALKLFRLSTVYYIKNAGFLLDLRVLGKTITTVLTKAGV